MAAKNGAQAAGVGSGAALCRSGAQQHDDGRENRTVERGIKAEFDERPRARPSPQSRRRPGAPRQRPACSHRSCSIGTKLPAPGRRCSAVPFQAGRSRRAARTCRAAHDGGAYRNAEPAAIAHRAGLRRVAARMRSTWPGGSRTKIAIIENTSTIVVTPTHDISDKAPAPSVDRTIVLWAKLQQYQECRGRPRRWQLPSAASAALLIEASRDDTPSSRRSGPRQAPNLPRSMRRSRKIAQKAFAAQQAQGCTAQHQPVKHPLPAEATPSENPIAVQAVRRRSTS